MKRPGISLVLFVFFSITSSVSYSNTCSAELNGCCIDTESREGQLDIIIPKKELRKIENGSHLGSRKTPVIMLTGQKGTPYWRISQNLETMMECDGIAFESRPTQGSEEILTKLPLKNIDAKFGIVQSDLLQYHYKNSKSVKYNIRVVVDLHIEEVHLIAGPDIETWKQLAGKKVFIGTEGSGTRFTAKNLIKLKDKLATPIIVTDSKDPLTDLMTGKIDAMFAVIGAPAQNLAANIFNQSFDFNLISTVSDTDNEIGYQKSTIKAGTYRNMNKDVETYAVTATLITYSWENNLNIAEFKQACNVTSELYSAIKSNIGMLKTLATPNENNRSWTDPNWLKVDPFISEGRGGITPRSRCNGIL